MFPAAIPSNHFERCLFCGPDGFWKFGTFSILRTRSPPPLNQSPLTRLKFCPPITSLFVSPAFIPAG